MTIRYATRGDSEILAHINAKSFQVAFRGIIPDNVLEDKFSYKSLLGRFGLELEERTTENSIIFKDGKPVGMQTFARDDDTERDETEIDIWRIYVLPEYWGSGVGKELILWGLSELKTKGYKKVALWVVDENERARTFYEKVGFSHDGEIRVINPGKEINELRYSMEI